MMDLKDKIKKLLALSASSNENEARDALLKAKELMAKAKLTDADFEDVKKRELVHLECKEATWTTDSGHVWMTDLCDLLCDNYLCSASWQSFKGRRTYTLIITGMEDDANLCMEVIKYAVGFINNAIKVLQRRNRTTNSKAIDNSYARGFIMGLEMAFEEQKEEHPEWGLVVVKPNEVTEYMDSLGSKSVTSRTAAVDQLALLRGYNDGMKFNAQKVLTCQ